MNKSPIDPRHKVLWHTDRMDQLRRTGTTNAPISVEIDLSNRCGLGCSWCHFAYTHTRGPLAVKGDKAHGRIAGGDLMDKALAMRIIPEMKRTGVQSITWTGGGEPTLHPDFDEIIKYAASVGIAQGIYTNGVNIGLERAALLKKYMTFVYISMDECEGEAYKRSKGIDQLARVIESTERLVWATGNATIGLGFLIHESNWQDIPKMVSLGKMLKPDYVQFRPTVHYEQDAPGIVSEDTSWMNEAVAMLETVSDDPLVVADIERFRMYQDWQGHGYRTCNWSAVQCVVTPNGKVWRCLNKREHADALLGDLNDVSFAILWQRAGGSCKVDGSCRAMCRGHIANLTLDTVMREPIHPGFI